MISIVSMGLQLSCYKVHYRLYAMMTTCTLSVLCSLSLNVKCKLVCSSDSQTPWEDYAAVGVKGSVLVLTPCSTGLLGGQETQSPLCRAPLHKQII